MANEEPEDYSKLALDVKLSHKVRNFQCHEVASIGKRLFSDTVKAVRCWLNSSDQLTMPFYLSGG